MLHKDPQREDSHTSEKPNWFQVGIPFVRVPMYQIYANLLPLLKLNLQLISCLMFSGEAFIFITCGYTVFQPPSITFFLVAVWHTTLMSTFSLIK